MFDKILDEYKKEELRLFKTANVVGMVSCIISLILWTGLGEKWLILASGGTGAYCMGVVLIIDDYLKRKEGK